MRPCRALAVLPLAIALVASPATAASGGPHLAWASLGDGTTSLEVSAAGRVGAWRLAVVGEDRRMVVVAELGDLGVIASVRSDVRGADGRWVHGRPAVFQDATDIPEPAQPVRRCDRALGVCFDSRTVEAPEGPRGRLAATFRLLGHGAWTLRGSVRHPGAEPFQLRPWRIAEDDIAR